MLSLNMELFQNLLIIWWNMLKKLFLLPLVIVISSVNIYGTEPFIENLAQRVQALEDRVNAHIPEKVVAPELSMEEKLDKIHYVDFMAYATHIGLGVATFLTLTRYLNKLDDTQEASTFCSLLIT
jgi:hypothetical protein